MEPIGCPETSVNNYQHKLHNISRGVKTSSTPRRKPEISRSVSGLPEHQLFSCGETVENTQALLSEHVLCLNVY